MSTHLIPPAVNPLPTTDSLASSNLPLQITFRKVQRSDAVATRIRAEFERLYRYYGRITSCSVLVEAPHRHHRSGDPFHIRIDLDVPRERLVIKHSPALRFGLTREIGKTQKSLEPGVAHKDAYLAVRDAFAAVRRRLQDYARRLRGEVKVHNRISPGRAEKLLRSPSQAS
jgi:ribosome-associated translation inhibitor RaiA